MKIRDIISTIAFLLVIFVISVGTLIRNCVGTDEKVVTDKEKKILEINGTLANKEDAEESQDTGDKEEKRDLNPYADNVGFNYEDLNIIDKWVVNFTDFQHYTDDFISDLLFDDAFIAANSKMSYYLSGGTYIESNKVLIGTNDYLFYKDKTDGDPISDYRGINLFDADDLLHITNDLLLFNNELEKRGVELYVLIIPNKEQVLSQYMPDNIYRNSLYSPGRQVYDFTTQNTGLKVIYPYEALINANEGHEVFFKTDTHANRLGAHVCFQEYMKARYGESDSLDDITITPILEGFQGDLENLTGLNEAKYNDIVYDISDGSPEMWKDETILLVGDSFTGNLTFAAGMYYKNVYRVDSIMFSMDMIDKYKPDVVLYEAGERRIEYFKTEDLYDR